jgi:hypothetical protein
MWNHVPVTGFGCNVNPGPGSTTISMGLGEADKGNVEKLPAENKKNATSSFLTICLMQK